MRRSTRRRYDRRRIRRETLNSIRESSNVLRRAKRRRDIEQRARETISKLSDRHPDMSPLDAIDAATRRYLQRHRRNLIDSIFTSDPLANRSKHT